MKVGIINPIMCSSNIKGLFKYKRLHIKTDNYFSSVMLKKALQKYADVKLVSSDFYKPEIKSKNVIYGKTKYYLSPIVAPIFDFNLDNCDKIIAVDFLQPATLKILKTKKIYIWQDLNHYPRFPGKQIFFFLKRLKRYNNVIKFIPKTNAAKEFLIKNGFKNIGNIISGGVDTNLFKFQKTESKFILSVGRLIKEKGHHILIKAMQGLNIRLVIVGDGPEKLNLIKLSKKLNVNVEFLSSINKHKLCSLYNKSYFTVFPSIKGETFGFVVLESFACKKTVITTDIPGPKDIITSNTGIIVKPNDVYSLHKAIIKLFKNEKLRKQLENNAYKHEL